MSKEVAVLDVCNMPCSPSPEKSRYRCLGNTMTSEQAEALDGSPLLLSVSLGHPLTPQDQLALKFDLDCCVYFDGPAVERSGLVAPLADGVYCGFGKNWVAINYCDFADAAVYGENYVK
jgi:hypothetical protein